MSEYLGSYYVRNGRLQTCNDFDASFLKLSSYIYEVFRVIDSIPLFLEDHIERLVFSARLTGHALPWSVEQIKAQVKLLIQANDVQNANLKIVYLPHLHPVKHGFIMYVTPHQYPSLQQYHHGVAAALFKGVRDNPNAKVMDVDLRKQTSTVQNVEDVYETLLVNSTGCITEGSRSNIFFVAGDVLVTPPLEDVLPGVTRKHIIECCREKDIPVVEEKVCVDRLKDIDGAFISGTSRRVLPLSRIDQFVFDPGHKLIREVQHAFNNRVTAYLLLAGLENLKAGKA